MRLVLYAKCVSSKCSNFQADEDQEDEDERWGRDSDMDVVDDWYILPFILSFLFVHTWVLRASPMSISIFVC